MHKPLYAPRNSVYSTGVSGTALENGHHALKNVPAIGILISKYVLIEEIRHEENLKVKITNLLTFK